MNFRLRQWALVLGDGMLCYLALILALVVRNGPHISREFYLLNAMMFAPVFLFWLPVLYAIGFYELRLLHSFYALIAESLLGAAFNGAGSIFLFYALEPYYGRGMTPKTNLLLTLIFAHAGFFLWRRLWLRIIDSKLLTERVAFLGNDPLIKAMEADLSARSELGCKVVNLSELEGLLQSGTIGFNPFLTRKSLKNKLPTDRVVVEESMVRSGLPQFRRLLDLTMACDVPLMNHLEFYESLYHKIPPYYAARPDWLLTNVLSRDKRFYAALKRLIDLVGSTVGLIFLSPLLILVVVGSWLSGMRRPIYSQKRFGYLGSEFQIWKFRTMVEGADRSGPLWDIPKQDARITGWGSFLRRSRLDELPQLWNVLKGEMSLVGPRPEWVEEVAVLEKTVPHYHLRHLVKPGISGWAQVNFRATNSPEDSLEKLRYDLFYVKNLSLALDIGILLKTLKRVVLKEEFFGRASRR